MQYKHRIIAEVNTEFLPDLLKLYFFLHPFTTRFHSSFINVQHSVSFKQLRLTVHWDNL